MQMSHRGNLLCESGAQSWKCKFGRNHIVDISNHGTGEDQLMSE